MLTQKGAAEKVAFKFETLSIGGESQRKCGRQVCMRGVGFQTEGRAGAKMQQG